jgi:YVTN family beta-propeller protein
MYVGLESDDRLIAIDTLTNRVIAIVPIGQAAQAVNYVPDAVPTGRGTKGLVPLGLAGISVHFALLPTLNGGATAPTSVVLYDQGIVQVLEAAVTGLLPRKPYILALSEQSDGKGALEPLTAFVTNAAGSQTSTPLVRSGK